MFIAELNLYLTYLQGELKNDTLQDAKTQKYYEGFCRNLLDGISSYRNPGVVTLTNRKSFDQALNMAEAEIEAISSSIGARCARQDNKMEEILTV